MIAVVGSGVLGLAVAEYLSRSQPVVVVSNEHPLAGSQAAAANLALKAQLFGRDAHFQLKIQARTVYREWLLGMLAEVNADLGEIELSFCEGVGLEYFLSEQDCTKQRERVTQPPSELASRGLGPQSMKQLNERLLRYDNEAWVDAQWCLQLLQRVLIKRDVRFVKMDIVKDVRSVDELLDFTQAKNVVLCTGAWTTRVLDHYGLPSLASVRISIGSTLEKDIGFNEVQTRFGSDEKTALIEFRARDGKHKVVLSGAGVRTIYSSSSERIQTVDDTYDGLCASNAELESIATDYFAPQPKTLQTRTGLRVGFGHTELVARRLTPHVIVCSGAHKSGFLFAPVVGKLVQDQLLVCSQ